MARDAAILSVHLRTPNKGDTRVGTLSRDTNGSTAFVVDEIYYQDSSRPVLSLGWVVPGDEDETRRRLANRGDKIGINSYLPPWFSGLLPEGALRDLVMAEMGPGNHDQFDLLTRLGADLPGAVIVNPETAVPASAGPLELANVQGITSTVPHGAVKFSLAGVQLKFITAAEGDRLTLPARSGEGRFIVKVPSGRYPGLPEAEYAAMSLGEMIGINVAKCRLMSTHLIDSIPSEFLNQGDKALVVKRFDRTNDGGRIHIEDAGQIVGATGERKYTMATYETILNMIRRFSTDPREDILEGFRRIVSDVLIGNGDNHLKNWSFIFPEPGVVRLSPAYDIVPTVLFAPHDTLALRLAGTQEFSAVNLHRFRRIAAFLGLDPNWIEREIHGVVNKALDLWPKALPDLMDRKSAGLLLDRMTALPFTKEVMAIAPGG